MSTASRRALGCLWTACFFVCPLLFFTDLTRNPYASQIALLNLALVAGLAVCALEAGREGRWRVPRTPLDGALAAWTTACAASWLWAYGRHAEFFRGSMRAEGAKAGLFLAVGCLAPFYFGASCARRDGSTESSNLSAGWPAFFLVWGVLWTLYSGIPRLPIHPLTTAGHLWDPFGGVLWILGFCALAYLARRGSLHDYWRSALGVAFLAGLYGICQYFGVEWVWPKSLNPYGGRSVSTFGNPNFASSFMVVLLPMAVLYFLKARRWAERAVFAAVFLAMEGCLLSSLTRSSWVGAAAGLAALFCFKPVRTLVGERRGGNAALLAAALALALLWPQTSVQGSTPTVLGRVAELGAVVNPDKAQPYSPFYQRALIWACAWTMGKENPLLGKGWGLFEMFYPFYQGPLLARFDFLRTLRTHGNGAHNELLEAWSQTGLLGTGALIWLWVVFFACVRRWLKSGAATEWTAAAAAGVAGMLVDNLLNVSLHVPVPAFLFWWQAGAAMGLSKPAGEPWRVWTPLSKALGWLLVLPLVAACAWAGRGWVRHWERDVHYFLGFKLFHNGRLGASIEELETAYAWHPREVNADYELGNAYARAERYDRALWAYGEALQSNTGYDEIYYNAGILLLKRLGRPEEGLKYLQTALWINPLKLEIYGALAAYYMSEFARYKDEARAALEQGGRLFPGNAAIQGNLSRIYRAAGEEAKAREAAERALRGDPDMEAVERDLRELTKGRARPAVLADLGLYRDLIARLGRKELSPATLELSKKAVAAFPGAPRPRFIVGTLELAQGRPEEALRWLEPLAREDVRSPQIQQSMGEAYIRLGRTADAVRAFQTALALDPANQAVRARLSQLGRP